MTKIAIITDAHANLPALEAALDALTAEGCEAIYHLGDAIGIGPYPAETLDRLLPAPKMRLLMGNHDAWFAFGLPHPRPAWMSEEELAHHRWVHAQLDPSWRPIVARWPYAIEEHLNGLSVAFTHYAWDEAISDFAAIVRNPTAADLDHLFAARRAALVFYGHHHPPSDLTGRARYVNPGALGCSTEPHARFAVLEVAANGGYTLRQGAVPYDPTDLWREFAEREVPDRDLILRAFFGRTSGRP